MPNNSFADELLAWHARAGRHDLPWQRQRTPYRVWVSEVMLQQTQVSTVIPYFERFIARFPDVRALADAPADAVLHLWSGLGYYARARNLQRAAQVIRDEHDGSFPTQFASVVALPGIGRSTAGAILALACDQSHPILDANVRRVLARVFAEPGRSGDKSLEERLWQRSADLVPKGKVARYTQAIMDVGATVCIPAKPACPQCPFQHRCLAHALGRPQDFPAPRKVRVRPLRQVWMLLARREDGAVRLIQRPASGIWGGLWSPPEFASQREVELEVEQNTSGSATLEPLDELRHAFTHFDLVIRPLRLDVVTGGEDVIGIATGVADSPVKSMWYNPARPQAIGLPAPVTTLIQGLIQRLRTQ
ncbi:MAG: A/G-specific adenine glycosylase [Pseudomonadota bacterium]